MRLSWCMGLFKLAAYYLVLKPAILCITSERNFFTTVYPVSNIDRATLEQKNCSRRIFFTKKCCWIDLYIQILVQHFAKFSQFFKMLFKLAEIKFKHRGPRVPIMTRLDFNMQVFGNRFGVFRIANWYWCVMIHIKWGLLNSSLIWENILECFLEFLHNNETLLHAVGTTF